MSTSTSLKGVQHYGEPQFSTLLESSLVTHFNWGFLGVGAFYNVVMPASGVYGGDQARLRLVRDNDYARGQVWEGFRQDWVWESGIEYGYQPVPISGVYVNGTLHLPASTGGFSHYVDYPQGRVVFDSPIDPSSVVKCEYSFRAVNFTTSDQAPWFRELMFNSFRVDDEQFLLDGSGAWDVLAKRRVQLPAVVIESVPNVRCKGMEIGSFMRTQRQDVLFHVFAESSWDKKQIHDMLVNQYEMRIWGVDAGLMSAANRLPLDYRGSLNPSGFMYPQMVQATGDGGYRWTQIRFIDVSSTDQDSKPPLCWTTVRYTLEMDLP